jgi:branched-chain amino acid transport system permease protein
MNKRFFVGPFKYLYLTLLLFIFLMLPLFADDYVLHVMIMIFLYSFLGLGWNITGGYTGLIIFGPTAFFGIGSYTSTVLLIKYGLSPWMGMFIGGVLGTILGLFIGFICFRFGIKGVYFALTTTAFSEIMRLVALNAEFANGARGILIPLSGNSLYRFQFIEKTPYYYIIFLIMVGALVITYGIDRSKLGDFFSMIREDEETAEAIGINTFKYKMTAMGFSSFLIAIGGSFYAQYFLYIHPDINFGMDIGIEVLLRPIIGGMGTVFGPVIGAFILGPLSEIIRATLGKYSGVYLMIYGLILMLVIIYIPGGVIRLFRKNFSYQTV